MCEPEREDPEKDDTTSPAGSLFEVVYIETLDVEVVSEREVKKM
jgi:hypothetical protein